jgi:phosphatidylserine decarboxylase
MNELNCLTVSPFTNTVCLSGKWPAPTSACRPGGVSTPWQIELSVQRAASALGRVFLQEDINFLLTNRIPRRYATLAAGWVGRIRHRGFTRLCVKTWSLFDDLRLHEAQTRDFASLQECFVRKLRADVRPIDSDPCAITSPCDAEIGAFGDVQDACAIQAKGFPYNLKDLLHDDALVERHRHGKFVTLRLRACMYHRFHSPTDGTIQRVIYISGDTWNVNPIALKRVENLFCKNERAVIPMELGPAGGFLTLVPIAAILVASIKLHFVPAALNLHHRGVREIVCDANVIKGDELGYFENGSTILIFAPRDFEFSKNVAEGATIRVGQALFHWSRAISMPQEERHEQSESGT